MDPSKWTRDLAASAGRFRQLVRALNSVRAWLMPVSCEPRTGPRQAALAGVAAPTVMAAVRAVPATMHKIRFLVISASDGLGSCFCGVPAMAS